MKNEEDLQENEPKWETEFIAEDNYFVRKLPRNCDINSKISFHKHIVVDGINTIEELDIKSELLKIDDDWFIKAYTDTIDESEDIHYVIKN